MLLFYLLFLGITLAIGYFILGRARAFYARFKQGARLVMVIDAGFLILDVIVWGYLMLVTIDALSIEIWPGEPKPYFLVTWGLGIVVYGIVSLFRVPIDAFLRQRFDDQPPKEPRA